MKRILILLMSAIMITSCGQPTEVVQNADTKQNSIKPVDNDNTNTELEVIGVYDTGGGHLYIYKFGTDTIYWAEGQSASWPVALQVK